MRSLTRSISCVVVSAMVCGTASVRAEDSEGRGVVPSQMHRVSVLVPEGAGQSRVYELLTATVARELFPWEEVERQNPHLSAGNMHPGVEVAVSLPSLDAFRDLEARRSRQEATVRERDVQIAKLQRDLERRDADIAGERQRAVHAEDTLVAGEASVAVLFIAFLLAGMAGVLFWSRTMRGELATLRKDKEALQIDLATAKKKKREVEIKMQLRTHGIVERIRVMNNGGRIDSRLFQTIVHELEKRPFAGSPQNGASAGGDTPSSQVH